MVNDMIHVDVKQMVESYPLFLGAYSWDMTLYRIIRIGSEKSFLIEDAI